MNNDQHISVTNSYGNLSLPPLHYLVIVEGSENSMINDYYITPKVDNSGSFIKFIGFQVRENNVENIIKNYKDLISSASALDYEDLIIPLSRVKKIKNLIFKKK